VHSASRRKKAVIEDYSFVVVVFLFFFSFSCGASRVSLLVHIQKRAIKS